MGRSLALVVGVDDLENIGEVPPSVVFAEEEGFHSVWVTESWGRDAFTALTLYAGATRRIMLGTGIVNVFSRSAAALAQHFVALNELSGGRAMAGIGVSGRGVIERFHGVGFESPLERMVDYINVMRSLWRGETSDWEGATVRISGGFRLRSGTVGDIPIYVGVMGMRSVERTAGLVDGWLMNWTPLDALAKEVSNFRGQATVGERTDRSTMIRSPRPVVIAKEPELARKAVADQLAFYICKMGRFFAQNLIRLGRVDEVSEIRRGWREGGRAGAREAVSEEFLDSVELVCGSVEGALERIEEQAVAGIDIHTVTVRGFAAADQRAIYRALVAG